MANTKLVSELKTTPHFNGNPQTQPVRSMTFLSAYPEANTPQIDFAKDLLYKKLFVRCQHQDGKDEEIVVIECCNYYHHCEN